MKKIIRNSLLLACATLSISAMVYASAATVTAPVPTPVSVVTAATTEVSAFTPAQLQQLDTIMHNYIVNNPQVLVEAAQTLQKQQQAKMETATISAITQNKHELFNDSRTPSIGNKEAPTTLVEFFDYQCGHCREMAPIIEKLVTQDKNLYVVFKEFPIFGGMSQYAAKAALAAAMQSHEKYYAFHTALLLTQSALTKKSVMELAKKVGLDVAKLKIDMELPTIEQQLKSTYQLAQALKLMGTPAFVISNKAETKFAYISGATSMQDLQTQIKSVG